MLTEKRALLDHAHRCRRIAGEVEHATAAKRLSAMATDYEQRAAELQDEIDAARYFEQPVEDRCITTA